MRVRSLAGPDAPVACALLVEERVAAGFVQGSGSLVAWERRRLPDGRWEVRCDVGAPGLGWLVRWALGRLVRGKGRLVRRVLPPGVFPQGSLDVVATVFWVATVVAYCGTLLGQTLAFAAPTLHASPLAQGVGSGLVRVDVLVALPIARLGDRVGRWRVLRAALVLATLATAAGALAPDLAGLVVTQVLAKAGATVAVLLANVIVAETVHAEGRAWTMGFLVLATALGAGLCAVAVAGLGIAPEAWRALFAIAIVGLVLVPRLRHRRDPARFRHSTPVRFRELTSREHRGRLILVAIAAALFNLFYLPASQFRNQFLRVDRHFAAWQISAFTIGANLPSGIGLAFGARLAETVGRRVLAAVGLAVGGVLLALAFLAHGVALVVLYAVGEAVGTMAVPALAVFGPELFPTRLRSGANGVIAIASRVGTVVGLVAVGAAASAGLGYGTPIAALAIGPIALAALVLIAFPETRARTLEDLNPEDAPPLAPGAGAE
ncbi:major facilitator superfamily MFS_1 [Acidimicrobium ferrooxidans DSM 10331]|uniref:Major facilitator superfamily MFS_1 n=1 Tax=Acidimicrobium ferrooxidans (strain DSM 10331 / JCM 15462 / NBRC 103882 / ICP) TaxID=525909 RepID=C7M148_ACIFD|nr:MFS transporter [Acidimicrobium ferrooxidans]ACU54696.1 major facilitator superfamily MFS_1 [Acidimicrobium ferrooxidans DSM 10331]